MPNAQMGSVSQLKLIGVSHLFFHWPRHIASVLEALTSRPETVLNWFSSLSNWEIDSVFLRKTLVSSPFMVIFTTWFLII